ncbi:hypothetical protein Tco_0148581, partial [Tanacetum coccineum]
PEARELFLSNTYSHKQVAHRDMIPASAENNHPTRNVRRCVLDSSNIPCHRSGRNLHPSDASAAGPSSLKNHSTKRVIITVINYVTIAVVYPGMVNGLQDNHMRGGQSVIYAVEEV